MEASEINGSLETGRAAFAAHRWSEAHQLLGAADAASSLSGHDLDRFGEAAFWAGRLDECLAAWERAYAIHLEAGDRPAAAATALMLMREYVSKPAPTIAASWFKRAARLLEDEPESTAHGYLAQALVMRAMAAGDYPEAVEQAERMVDLGTRLGDRDLLALGLHRKGHALVAAGEVADGMDVLDEAAVAAVSGELAAMSTAIIYCGTVSACRNVADYGRAGEWTDAARRWCDRQAIAGFPGLCRIYHAEITRLRGDWSRAEEEVQRACQELDAWGARGLAAAGFHELGEIRLRMGDLEGAEAAFCQAHELGELPQPGLALVHLARGDLAQATRSLEGALEDDVHGRLGRARLLPALVEVALATGDAARAATARDELEQIAADFGTSALAAQAALARAGVALTEGDLGEARRSARESLRLRQDLEMPFEAAQARMVLGAVHRAEGDSGAARLELQAAHSGFERLGAALEARRAADALAAETPAAPADGPRVRATKTFMFTDVVRSTSLLEALGDEAWEDVLRWHDGALRACFGAHDGEEVKSIGDGFFVVFADPAEAIDCAVQIQCTLAEHRKAHGFAPQVRIGLHAAEATQREGDYSGQGVNQAARIGALAEGGEILASVETLDAAKADTPCGAERTVQLKGIAAPVTVRAVEWR